MNDTYGPTLLRLGLGLLFIVPGISKLFDPSGITGMLSNIGFPMAALFAWLLIAVEILFGLAVLLGFMVEWVVWPLVVVLLMAVITVTIPNGGAMVVIQVLFHLVAILGLISLFVAGPGELAVK